LRRGEDAVQVRAAGQEVRVGAEVGGDLFRLGPVWVESFAHGGRLHGGW
jgi:hypothetical protein